jgi:hypothetical protein
VHKVSLNQLLVVLLACLACSEVRAAAAPGSVQIDVRVIAASHGNTGVDPRVETLRRRMSRENAALLAKYPSSQLLSEQTISLSLNQHQTVQLPENYTLEITPLQIEPTGLIQMHLHVHRPDQDRILDTVYAIEPGKDLVVGGMKHHGGVLLVALHHGGSK